MTPNGHSPVIAYIGLGANLGDAIGTLLDACEALHQLPETKNVRVSGFYKTAPIDATGPDYINAVAEITTHLAPLTLLHALFAIEHTHGRERSYINAPRTLDLDLLLYGNQTIASTELTVPHPRMHQRAFVLKPLVELAPNLQLHQRSVTELLANCADQDITPLDKEI